MYICGACRGAAVTITKPGLVGVWQWASLNRFSFNIFARLHGDILLCVVIMRVYMICLFV